MQVWMQNMAKIHPKRKMALKRNKVSCFTDLNGLINEFIANTYVKI